MTLQSTPRSITRVEPYLSKVGHALRLDEIQMNKLMVSVTEAVNNAILHGNKQDRTKKVRVRSEMHQRWLLIVVSDEGRGFNPRRLRNPLKRENLALTNGRGVFLMRTLMDKVEFESDGEGTSVLLWLDLDKEPVE